MQQVDEAMVALAAEIQPSHLELEYMKAAFGMVQTLLLRQFPTAKVHLYGSAATGTLVTGSRAIDICLELREVGQSKPERAMVLDILQDILQAEGMAEVLALPKARVPVIKFVVPATGTRVDLTVNNMLPLVNTHLLRCYVAVDPRLRQLVLLVKHWAKRRGVNDTYRGTLSSYSYVLLCIALLQQRSPPILPKLQAMQPASLMRYEVTTGSWACTFCDDIDALQGCGAANTETLAELLLAFFDHWAWRHDYNNAVVSIRTGCMLAKRDKDWCGRMPRQAGREEMRRVERDWHLMSIEDPFDLSHDLGRTVDWRSIRTLRTEFERAARVMALEARDPLQKLLQPVPAPVDPVTAPHPHPHPLPSLAMSHPTSQQPPTPAGSNTDPGFDPPTPDLHTVAAGPGSRGSGSGGWAARATATATATAAAGPAAAGPGADPRLMLATAPSSLLPASMPATATPASSLWGTSSAWGTSASGVHLRAANPFDTPGPQVVSGAPGPSGTTMPHPATWACAHEGEGRQELGHLVQLGSGGGSGSSQLAFPPYPPSLVPPRAPSSSSPHSGMWEAERPGSATTQGGTAGSSGGLLSRTSSYVGTAEARGSAAGAAPGAAGVGAGKRGGVWKVGSSVGGAVDPMGMLGHGSMQQEAVPPWQPGSTHRVGPSCFYATPIAMGAPELVQQFSSPTPQRSVTQSVIQSVTQGRKPSVAGRVLALEEGLWVKEGGAEGGGVEEVLRNAGAHQPTSTHPPHPACWLEAPWDLGAQASPYPPPPPPPPPPQGLSLSPQPAPAFFPLAPPPLPAAQRFAATARGSPMPSHALSPQQLFGSGGAGCAVQAELLQQQQQQQLQQQQLLLLMQAECTAEAMTQQRMELKVSNQLRFLRQQEQEQQQWQQQVLLQQQQQQQQQQLLAWLQQPSQPLPSALNPFSQSQLQGSLQLAFWQSQQREQEREQRQ